MLGKQIPKQTRTEKKGYAWVPLLSHLHVFSLLDQLANTYTFFKIKFISPLLPGLLVCKVEGWLLDRVSTNLNLIICNLSEWEF